MVFQQEEGCNSFRQRKSEGKEGGKNRYQGSDNGGTPSETQDMVEDGIYTSKDKLALYIHTYHKLPQNFITKEEAEALGWPGGSLLPYAPDKCIGGDRFGNYEKKLPEASGRIWWECDVNTLGASSRGAERILFSNDWLIYYTPDHYETFRQLY